MVHQYKLVYFNGRGRAEPARLIFAYAGQKYEDKRLQPADWAALKPKTPFGQLPLLDIDNGKVVLSQSKAIARYLGNEFNLVPKDHIQAAKGDMLVDGLDDLMGKFGPWFREQDPAKKKELWTKLETDEIVPFLKLYEKLLAEGGTTYFTSNNITWADLALFNYIQSTQAKSPDLFKGLPKLTEFVNKISKEPKIKAWLDVRPQSDF